MHIYKQKDEYPLFTKYLLKNTFIRNEIIDFLHKLNASGILKAKNYKYKAPCRAGFRICFTCGEEKPETVEYFYVQHYKKNGEKIRGYRASCKVCESLKKKEYYKKVRCLQ